MLFYRAVKQYKDNQEGTTMSPRTKKQANQTKRSTTTPQTNPANPVIEVNTLPLVYDEGSKVLILGIFPGELSLKYGFYYCDSGNRFWEVMEELFNDRVPWGLCERREYLRKHGVALWDVGACVEKTPGNVSVLKPNAICCLLKMIKQKGESITVFCNGGDAKEAYDEYIKPNTAVGAKELPSTSGRNSKYSLSDLVNKWEAIL